MPAVNKRTDVKTMIKIGITGNIGSGKSAVENFLKDSGYSVIDSDEIVHDLIENSTELKKELMYFYGHYDILTENSIDRKKLAKVVFNSEKLRKHLEELIHPLVINEIKKFFVENKDKVFAFVSVPLLFEANCQDLFDKIILVASKEETRFKRLTLIREMSEEDAKARMKAQMPQEAKIELADYVIYNDSTFADLISQVNDVMCKLL